MFILVSVWGDREAQACGWGSLEDTGYAEEIREEQIHMAIDAPEESSPEREEVEGEEFTGIIGSFIRDRLYSGEATLIRAADGTVWVDYDIYEQTVL